MVITSSVVAVASDSNKEVISDQWMSIVLRGRCQSERDVVVMLKTWRVVLRR